MFLYFVTNRKSEDVGIRLTSRRFVSVCHAELSDTIYIVVTGLGLHGLFDARSVLYPARVHDCHLSERVPRGSQSHTQEAVSSPADQLRDHRRYDDRSGQRPTNDHLVHATSTPTGPPDLPRHSDHAESSHSTGHAGNGRLGVRRDGAGDVADVARVRRRRR